MSDSRIRRTTRCHRRLNARPADTPDERPGAGVATIASTLVVIGTRRARFRNTAGGFGQTLLARERKVGWQRGHQNRLRPASPAVRTVAPQT